MDTIYRLAVEGFFNYINVRLLIGLCAFRELIEAIMHNYTIERSCLSLSVYTKFIRKIDFNYISNDNFIQYESIFYKYSLQFIIPSFRRFDKIQEMML